MIYNSYCKLLEIENRIDVNMFASRWLYVFIVFVCLVSDKIQASSTISSILTVVCQEGWYRMIEFVHFTDNVEDCVM